MNLHVGQGRTTNPIRENHIRNLNDVLEAERRQAHTEHFTSQLHNAEAGNMSISGDQAGATGGQRLEGPPPPPPRSDGPGISVENPANVNIVNEYNAFSLANVTPPVARKWKQTDTLLDDFRKFKYSCQRIFDGLMCHITSSEVKTSILLIWARPDGEDIYEALIYHQIRSMTSTMYYSILRNSVSQYATSGPQDLNPPRCCNTKERLSTHFITESSSCQDSVNFQIHMNA